MNVRLVILLGTLWLSPLAVAQEPAPAPTEAPPPVTTPTVPAPEQPEASTAGEPAATPPAEPAALPQSDEELAPATSLPATTPEVAGEGAVPDLAVPTAEPAPGEAIPVPEPGAPPVEQRRVVVLPPEFKVFVQSAGGARELEPSWTEAAQLSLTLAAERHLRHDERFAIAAPVDSPSAEEEALLREHVELFKIVATDSIAMIRYGGKAWQDKKNEFDYSLGSGLGFLADRTGADFAFMIGGAQVKQTGGSVFMQLAMAATLGVAMPGGGTYLVLSLVDLRSGEIVWFNSLEGGEVFGMTGSDLRSPETADETLGKLFDPFPASKLFSFRMF